MTIRIAPPDMGDLATPATEPQPGAGLGTLATSRGNLPLEALDIRAVIAGTTASVELAQGFRNPFDVALEATYIFPLPDRAAVTAMRMEAGGHVVEAVLKERGQARTDYDMAVARGHRAAIAEEDRPEVFTMRVGNIVAGEQVTVRLQLAQPLPVEDGEMTFRFPLVVAPRYIPGSPLGGGPAGSGVAADTDAVPDASRISPPVLLPGFPNPVRLSLRAEIDPAGLALADTRCSLHATAEETGPSGRTVVALRPGEQLDRDFILRLAVANRADVAASLLLTPDAGQDPVEGTFLLTLLPPIGQGAARPRDVALVLDRSGSMSGWKMVAARRAAARIVDTLTTADRFAVFCFDNVVERPPGLPDGLAEATDRNRFRAVEFLSRTAARGGTEMLDPLDRAAGLLAGRTEPETATAGPAAASGRDRVLVLITDGQVGNEDQILRHLGSQLAGIRVHAVGIDQAVNAGFLGRLATTGGGRCELVESEDRLDAAAARIHRRIGAPLAAGLTLSGDGLQIVPDTVAPSRLPDLFPGVPLTVAGRWRGQPGGTVTVRGTSADGQPFEAKAVAVTGGSPASRALWARAHLRDLEDRYASLDPSGPAELARLEQQITSVSLRHGVLCRFTAFVATDTRVVTDGGAPHRVTQPVELPSGWDPAACGFPPAARHPGPMPLTGQPARRLTPLLQAAAGGADPAAPTAAQWTRTGRPGVRAAMAAPSARAQGRMVVQTHDAHRLALARHQAADEAAALGAARHEPESERRRLLADLASRLDALMASLADAPSLWQQRASLAGLASKLRDCDQSPLRSGAELDALWDETIALLTAFGNGRLPADKGPRSLPHPFWKRQA